ncbi:uncharacterized protein PV09_04376 [Verruconis gallopava]|uniref:RRM domain-containing protein n=1 Tax=Verruconis gallopava TaxID=253628 RepID=A0A0D2ADT9_9PEZI|nr:uncharacterized protein PV09_04376 [Verruconis gallopava]KIW04630.1 hypothetical protein PV09_04376 [Verruconis gallopava]
MAGYYNQQLPPPNYGSNSSFHPSFPAQQPPQGYGNNAYNPPAPTAFDQQLQYSTTGQSVYGMEPTTPVLDQNQMNWFWSEVRSGHIPTIPSAQGQPTFAPPPQMPPQQAYHAHPPPPQQHQQYQYPPPQQYGSQTSTRQNAFPTQQSAATYNSAQDVPMDDAYKDDEDWSDGDEEYAPPDINNNNNDGSVSGTNETIPGLGHISQGNRTARESDSQPLQQPLPPFNPFKSQSLHTPPSEPPPPASKPHIQIQVQPKSSSVEHQPKRPNIALRDKAGEVLRDFHAHGIGYAQLSEEPGFDEFEKNLLRQLYTQYNIPQESPQPVTTSKQSAASSAVHESSEERLSEVKRLLESAGFEIDDVTLASLAKPRLPPNAAQQEPVTSTLPGLGAMTTQQQQESATPPHTRPLSTSASAAADITEGRSAYLAKLKAMKGKTVVSSHQSTPVQTGAQTNAPGPGASTPRRAMINQEALKRKLLEKREALARAAAAGVVGESPSGRASAPLRTESVSDIAYESGQASAPSGSEATNTPVIDMSSPEETEELGEGEEGNENDGPETGEISEVATTKPIPTSVVQQTAQPSGLPQKSAEPSISSYVANNSDQSVRRSPRSGLPARPPGATSRYSQPYPPAVHSPGQFGRPWQQDLKRPASSAFGSPWSHPQAKRPYPPQPVDEAPEPVVIDISSEEEDEEDDMSVGELDDIQHGRSTWKRSMHQSGQSSGFATPPVITTPDPVTAARQEEHARQKALIEAKRDALKRQIQLKEAQKSQVSTGHVSPATAISAPNSSASLSKDRLTKIRSSSMTSHSSPSVSASAARQAALKSLEADIRTDEQQLEALQAQIDSLKRDMERKNREKDALAKEIREFGVDPEGLSFVQMREMRDSLAEGAPTADTEQDMAINEDDEMEEEEEEGEEEEEEEEEEEGEEESVEEKSGSQDEDDRREVFLPQNADDSIPEADDPRALASGSRIQIHNISFRATKQSLRRLLGAYDITGISLPNHNKKQMKKKQAGHALVDFLYPAEAEDAIAELKGKVFEGLVISVGRVAPPSPQGTRRGNKQVKEAGASGAKAKDVRGHETSHPVQIRVSRLAERLCNPTSFQGWLGRFVHVATNINFVKDKSTQKPIGVVYLELPDYRTASELVQVKSGRSTRKSPFVVEIIEGDDDEYEPEPPQQALGFLQALKGTTREEPVAPEVAKVEVSDDESDDEEEDDDAMCESEDGSEEGEVSEKEEEKGNEDHISSTQHVPHSHSHSAFPVIAEASDEMNATEFKSGQDAESSENDDEPEIPGDLGAVLHDVEDVPMDEDDVDSSEEFEVETMSDDEEGESEEKTEPVLPGGEGSSPSEESSAEEGEEEAEEFTLQVPDVAMHPNMAELASKHGATNESQASDIGKIEEIRDELMTGVVPSVGEHVEAQGPLAPAEPSMSSEQGFNSATADVAMAEGTDMLDDNDDDFYEPDVTEVVAEPGPAYQPSTEYAEEDEYDPELNAEPFPETDDVFANIGGARSGSNDANTVQLKEPGKSSGDNGRDGEEGAQPDEEPTSVNGGGALPGNTMNLQNEVPKAAEQLSEDGEVLTESDSSVDGEEKAYVAATAVDNAVPSPSLVSVSGLAHHADDHFDDTPSPRISFPIPKMRPLGSKPPDAPKTSRIEDSANINSTVIADSKYTPYQSPLKFLKSYRYHPNFSADVPGGMRSLTYSHKLDARQPLCQAELEGGTCNHPLDCSGQHFNDYAFSDSDIIKLIGSIDPSRPQEEKVRWSNGVKKLIAEIQKEGIKDLESIAQKVVAHRRVFFGNSILGYESPAVMDFDVRGIDGGAEVEGDDDQADGHDDVHDAKSEIEA